MYEPTFVFAEAVVKSNRGAPSIFEADPREANFKQFIADPAMVRDAVTQLKNAGFQISFADKYTISFFGSKPLFEEKFNVSLKAVPLGAGTPSKTIFYRYVIDKNPPTIRLDMSTTDFQAWLRSVVLQSPAVVANAAIPPPKQYPNAQFYVYEIPGELNLDDVHKYYNGVGIRVAIIDGGYFKHPFITQQYPTKITVKYTDRVYQAHLTASVNYRLLGGDANKKILEKYEKFRASPDASGHGTSVVANLLAVAPKAEVLMVKEAIEDSQYTEAFSIIKEFRPHVLCCSFGKPLRVDEFADAWVNFIPYQKLVRDLVENFRTIVLYAAGNYDPQNPDLVFLEPQFDEVISVGGAFRNGQTITASNAAHGYPARYPNQLSPLRAIPTTCGIVGPLNNLEFIMVPQPPTKINPDGDWAGKSGTSMATPQIAGVCALMKSAFPAAKPEQIQLILQRTARPIVAGQTLQNQNMHNIDLGGGLNPGLVDIRLAVMAAHYMAYGLNIDEAIAKARG